MNKNFHISKNIILRFKQVKIQRICVIVSIFYVCGVSFRSHDFAFQMFTKIVIMIQLTPWILTGVS